MCAPSTGVHTMLELAGRIGDAVTGGRTVAVATVVAINGSAPRSAGATMFLDESGAVVGSVSGDRKSTRLNSSHWE